VATTLAAYLASFERYLSGRDFKEKTFIVDEPHLTDHDQTLLESSDPLAVLKLSPFEALKYSQAKRLRKPFWKLGATWPKMARSPP
jgi:hypothetical protein